MPQAAEAFFASTHAGALSRRFCIWHTPPEQRAPKCVFVHVHAFAEEMNKSRRMVAMQARALAGAGHAVLQIDLLGCGDSDGSFGDATWQAWLGDVNWACAWAQARFAQDWPGAATPQWWLWGQRLGCLLANQACTLQAQAWHLLYWQPSLLGKTVLQQFLRLHTVGALIKGAGETNNRKTVKPQELLEQGRSVEVAGYVIHPDLARGMQAAVLEPPPAVSASQRLIWLDVADTASADPNPSQLKVLAQWQQTPWAVMRQTVTGPNFWQTTEIEDAPALLAATLGSLQAQGLGEHAPWVSA